MYGQVLEKEGKVIINVFFYIIILFSLSFPHFSSCIIKNNKKGSFVHLFSMTTAIPTVIASSKRINGFEQSRPWL